MRSCIVKFADRGGRLDGVLSDTARLSDFQVIGGVREFARLAEKGFLRDSRIIFAAETDSGGTEPEAFSLIRYIWQRRGEDILKGSVGGIIIDGSGDMFTKDLGRKLAFAANAAGCAFPGKPLVEATGELRNFRVLSDLWKVSPRDAYRRSCDLLVNKVLDFEDVRPKRPSILVIHASNKATSNSLSLWDMTESSLKGRADTELISIRNGQLWDCRGCKYEECLHFGENGGCFYGGVMVEKVYPAIVKSDVLVLICPNYNDSVSANMMAFINRLTAVFRARDFSKKRVYAIIVSGYSGGDLVAQQVIGAINMNKNLILPERFALMVTANDPGEAAALPGIEEKTAEFAERIVACPSKNVKIGPR